MRGIPRRAALAGSLALPGLLRAAGTAFGSDGALRLIVPFAAGGANDDAMRAIAALAAPRLGQPIAVENHPGRRGLRAITALASAPGDAGLLAQLPVSAVRAALMRGLPFDAARDTTPVIGLAGRVFGCVARAGRFPGGWAGFLAEARERPGALAYGSPGRISTAQQTMARLLLRENVQVAHVPFRGATDGVRALLAEDIDVMAGPAQIGEAVSAGQAAWLNVWTAQRLARWPDAPTLRDLGYGLVVTAPFGIVAPPGLPAARAGLLHDAFLAALRDAPVRAVLDRLGMTEDHRDGPAYAAFLAEARRAEETALRAAERRP